VDIMADRARHIRGMLEEKILWRGVLGFLLCAPVVAFVFKPLFNCCCMEIPFAVKCVLAVVDIWQEWWFVAATIFLIAYRLLEIHVLRRLPIRVLVVLSWTSWLVLPLLIGAGTLLLPILCASVLFPVMMLVVGIFG
jgi:hypothetical protein